MIQVVLKGISADTLLKNIHDLINQNRIQTWEYDAVGDYTMTPLQWRRQAWIRLQKEEGETIKFGIIPRRDAKLSKEVYAIYHGRFAEMLLAHFDINIAKIEISSLLVKGIDVF